jgi:hypothetical protein
MKNLFKIFIALPLFFLIAYILFGIPALLTYIANTGMAGYFFFLFTILLIVQCFNLSRAYQSIKWPTTDGTVTESRIKHDGDVYTPKVVFEYSVDGHEYVNDSITTKQTPNTHSDRRPREIISKYPIGSRVKIYYNPNKPRVSYLVVGVGPSNWFVSVLFLIGSFGAGIWTRFTWQGLDPDRLDIIKILQAIRNSFPFF